MIKVYTEEMNYYRSHANDFQWVNINFYLNGFFIFI
jgi:hypothetical protein